MSSGSREVLVLNRSGDSTDLSFAQHHRYTAALAELEQVPPPILGAMFPILSAHFIVPLQWVCQLKVSYNELKKRHLNVGKEV